MPLSHHNAFLTAWVLYVCAVASSEGANATLSVSAEPAAAPVSLLLSAFPDDLEVSDYCSELLRLFGQRYVAYVNCLVPAARPVKVCQNCFGAYGSLATTYMNISSEQDLWTKAACDHCINDGFRSLTDDTLYFMSILNQTLTCFERYQQGNHTELCKNCKSAYKGLNELYSGMEKNGTMCIDIEDGMNMTRRLWSKNFKCSLPREETVPVIAVSSFMLFLPIIFYLSSFLHSEQKKRKLIHPKRAKSYASSLMNIRDKRS
ncbi:osteopetrosis-associated transmembrane protein 1 isoform X2 [Phycodurus eques]|uniref:osteopetrosis-associated transmembrane protein 1 isoform X2 n=1 Tax=Phycodurus eques TaxID=693459 RepID=UPI002ACD5007|nr:osteopetrosis-associated transmembrane protein 1 isoform X2 [Phycodurus eques]